MIVPGRRRPRRDGGDPARRLDRRREYHRFTFAQLDEDSDRIARGLVHMGVLPGTRLALLVRPSYEFIALVFGLFKSGAVQILVDPGMGRRRLLRCLDEVVPEGFIAIPPVQAVRSLLRRYPTARFNVTVGRRWFWRGPTLRTLLAWGREPLPLPRTGPDDPAAIIFTTGSTGPPKGVLYRHGNFDRQVEEIKQRFDIASGGVDLACFPLFALFNAGMGAATVIPDMDASRPARVDPRNIVEPINDLGVSQSFASPAVWDKVGRYCELQGLKLPSLTRVMSAGAPVHRDVVARMRRCLPDAAQLFTPYGATEALPVASIESREILEETSKRTAEGAGVCVGRRFPGIEWRVIGIVDGPIASIEHAQDVHGGEIGELIVRGPVVTTGYVGRPDADALAKIDDEGGRWHRMGDVGWLDDQERFWFCGRLAHRVTTPGGALFTIPCEAIFNRHEQVRRSALVGVGPRGAQLPVMIVEPESGHWPRGDARKRFLEELAELARASPLTRSIERFLFHRAFPVDIRHNAKIFREKLAIWAARRM